MSVDNILLFVNWSGIQMLPAQFVGSLENIKGLRVPVLSVFLLQNKIVFRHKATIHSTLPILYPIIRLLL